MAKKNIELLKRLRARFLRMRHKKHFDMGAYAERNECGTSMCIAGHALDLQGYKIRFEDGWPVFFNPEGQRVTPMNAAERELGLPHHEAYDLFHDFSLKTPKQAAKRIEKIIAEAS